MGQNSFQFFGLVGEKTPSTNLIWAFTPGMLDDRGWLSEKTGGGDLGLFRMVKEGIENSRSLLLAVPFQGAKTADFEKLLKEGQAADILKIRVFDSQLKKYTINILVKNVTVGPIVPSWDVRGEATDGARHNLCSLAVKSADFEAA